MPTVLRSTALEFSGACPPGVEAPRIVAVDDWAEQPKVPAAQRLEWLRRRVRKGRTYCTVVVDLEGRHVADLLPGGACATVAVTPQGCKHGRVA